MATVLYALFAMTDAQLRGDAWRAVMAYMHEFYFESAAMILTLITVGKMLEARSKGRTTDALKSLMQLGAEDGGCSERWKRDGSSCRSGEDWRHICGKARREYSGGRCCARRKQRGK